MFGRNKVLIAVGGLVVIAVLSLGVVTGCDRPAAARVPQLGPTKVIASPIRVVVVPDYTRSMAEARVPHVTPHSLDPLFDVLSESGGELAVGMIRDRSDAPLVRLYIPAPPEPPTERPEPQNIFDAAAARRRQDAEEMRYAPKLQAWRGSAKARVSAFAEAITPLLESPADAPKTDIISALRRSDLYLSEPAVFPRTPRKAIVLVTDGVETVSPETVPSLSSGAEVILVNGTGSVGVLAPLHPLCFESLEAALRYLVSEGAPHVRR